MSEVEQENTSPSDLVVVGSSAGGIEALSILVGSLPANFPAPIVLAQHLDPSHPSSLDQILQRHTTLPVEVVTSQLALRAGCIYVVPANRNVSINDGQVEVHGDRTTRPQPSVDLLLSTAAQVYGEHLTAVILTGSGSDGAAGAVEVKNAGGTVIVQDPQTARYPSMPLALPPTIIDFTASIEHIGPLLNDLLTGASLPQPEERTEEILPAILEQVKRQANLDFRPYKPATILRRIARRMAVTHTRTIQDYVEYLRTHPEEVGQLVQAFLIHGTQFFRDAGAFASLKSDILPKLIEEGRGHDRVLRIWSAGCATGEEPYSIAMLLTDLFGAELPQWSIKIFATDVDEAAITFARRGVYTEPMLKGLPLDYRDRFFEHVEHGYRIAKTLRQMVIFGQQDLSRSTPFPRIDLVLCRNVLIYFTPELQDSVLSQFAFSLSPHGYLLLGKAETVRPTQPSYDLVNKQWKVYRCTGKALPAPRRQRLPTRTRPLVETRPLHPARSNPGHPQVEEAASSAALDLGQLRRFNELLLRFLPIGVVVIDRNYHLLTANGAARRLLGLLDPTVEQDFLHAVRGIPYTRTREAIDALFRERSALTLPEVELEVTAGGNGRFVSLSLALMQLEAGAADLASISVTEVTEQVQTRRHLERAEAEQAQLMQELSASNKRLSGTNKDLMEANEELQVANEELVLTHEELQASIEEFETTNEELQATNEELETNNEELQATNEELETTNDELRARTSELQELSAGLERERGRLAAMVDLAPFSMLVLRGPSLLVEAYSPHYARVLEGGAVHGHPLEEVFDLFWELETPLVRLAREVYQQDVVRTTPPTPTALSKGQAAPALAGRSFVFTLVPSHDTTGKVDGVMIYGADETEQRARQAEQERDQLQLVLEHTPGAFLALYDGQSAQTLLMSPTGLAVMQRAYGLHPGEVLGRPWFEVALAPSGEEAQQVWQAVLEQRAAIRTPHLHYPFPDGEQTVWDRTLTPLPDQEQPERIRFVLVSALQMTEQVQARQPGDRLDQLTEDVVDLATHDLRTPLTTLLGNAQALEQLLRRQASSLSPEEGERLGLTQELALLDTMTQQGSTMTQRLEQFLEATGLGGNSVDLAYTERVDFVALTRRVVEQFSHVDYPLTLKTQQERVVGTADEGRVEQVLKILMRHALTASPQDKPITVTVQGQATHPEEVVITVHDEGQGISREEQAHLFERFSRVPDQDRAKAEGLGLELSLAHQMVVQHGGRLWLESQPGQGTTFSLSLPLKRPESSGGE